jgi:dihydroxy-acid dehydratase
VPGRGWVARRYCEAHQPARGRIDLAVAEPELARRKSAWKPPAEAPTRGYAKLYMDHVLQAEHGCDFDFLRKA